MASYSIGGVRLTFCGKTVGVRRVTLTLATAATVAVGVWAPAGSAAKPCWQVLVTDWSDGAISNLYPIHCYRQALQNMPEDVRLYSNAGGDINRALAGRVVKRGIAGGTAASAPKPVSAAAAAENGMSDAPFVLVGALAAALVVAGWAGYLAKRKWRGAARLGGPHT